MNRASYLEFITKRGSNKRERDINRGRSRLNRHTARHLSLHEATIDGVEVDVNIISTTILTKKTMVDMSGNPFYLGQVVEWNNAHWIVVEKDMDNTLVERGTIELCNGKLRWQNRRTGEIVERWAIIDKPYFSNLSENKVMTISQRKFNIMMPYDEETALLDVGRRLMPEVIDEHPKTYRITSVDSFTDRYQIGDRKYGCINIDYEQDQFNPESDNLELMVCDYLDIDSQNKRSMQAKNIKIVFNGQPVIKIGSPRKVYKAICNGELVEGCTWSVVCSDVSFVDYISTEVNDNKCYIEVANNKEMIGNTISIDVTCDGYTDAHLDLEVISQ